MLIGILCLTITPPSAVTVAPITISLQPSCPRYRGPLTFRLHGVIRSFQSPSFEPPSWLTAVLQLPRRPFAYEATGRDLARNAKEASRCSRISPASDRLLATLLALLENAFLSKKRREVPLGIRIAMALVDGSLLLCIHVACDDLGIALAAHSTCRLFLAAQVK